MSFKYLQSRTVWTAILAFVIGGVQAITEFLPPTVLIMLEGILSALVVRFRIDQKVDFGE